DNAGRWSWRCVPRTRCSAQRCTADPGSRKVSVGPGSAAQHFVLHCARETTESLMLHHSFENGATLMPAASSFARTRRADSTACGESPWTHTDWIGALSRAPEAA